MTVSGAYPRLIHREGEDPDTRTSVEIRIYPWGSSKLADSAISKEFGSEAEIDDWIRAFKGELDQVADDAKQALRASRSRRGGL
ncbi:MAG: hypothetical protein JO273_25860 [Methylobacteriaceae bacterium]|nr:hypothetical protein [Methylobacteriaceae bacterium]